MQQVRAIDTLMRAGEPVPVDRFTETLIWAAANPYGDYLGARAASMAGRALDFVEAWKADDDLEWPSETPDELAGADYWPGSSDPFADVDQGDSQGMRDAWRERVYGPAPWKPESEPLDDNRAEFD